MSSPLSSLDKSKKSPFNPSKTFGRRSVPFRSLDLQQTTMVDKSEEPSSKSKSPASSPSSRKKKVSSESESNGARSFLSPTHNSRLSPINPSRKSPGYVPTHKASSPNDVEVMATMMKRITQLEKQVAFYTREVFDKDKRIKVLEEKLALIRKSKPGNGKDITAPHSREVDQLQIKCHLLQKQVDEMETFLSDYGMVWVGESPGGKNLDRAPVAQFSTSRRAESHNRAENFKIDYDLIIKNVRELNLIAGEGMSKIQKTKGGAQLKQQESVPLTLYANGIWMFNGPFRSNNEYTTMRCLGDLMDGFFPSELQRLYPEGVPLKITDKRTVIFKDPKAMQEFPGKGRVLQSVHRFGSPTSSEYGNTSDDGSLRPRSFSPTSFGADTNYGYTSEPPSHRLTTNQFLNKLPPSVIHDNKVLPIRSALQDHLTGADPSSKGISEPVNTISPTDPAKAGNIATIRVKSGDGLEPLIFEMKFSDTIGDLRHHINDKRRSYIKYDIMSTFPMQKHNNPAKTLDESGLTPNATLHLKLRK